MMRDRYTPGANSGEGPMNSGQLLRALVCGALMLGVPTLARAEGTFDIPAGARFNEAKLAKISEFFANEVATGKIAGRMS